MEHPELRILFEVTARGRQASMSIPGITGGVVSDFDAAGHTTQAAAVLLAGMTLAGVSEASGASAVVYLATSTIAVPNLPPSHPFNEANVKWTEVAQSLRDLRNELDAAVNQRAAVDASWSGPGADAFCAYANNTLLPAIDKLAACADEAAQTCGAIRDTLDLGLIIYLATVAAGIVLCIIANYYNSIPLVGAFIAAMLKWIIVDAWIFSVLYTIYDMLNTLLALQQEQASMEEAMRQLATVFSTDGSKFDAAALELMRREVESVMQDPSGWNKS